MALIMHHFLYFVPTDRVNSTSKHRCWHGALVPNNHRSCSNNMGCNIVRTLRILINALRYMFHVVIMRITMTSYERDGVSNHQPQIVYSTVCSGADQGKHQRLRVTSLCEGNSSVTDEFPAQRTSDAENVSIWWRHHGLLGYHWVHV